MKFILTIVLTVAAYWLVAHFAVKIDRLEQTQAIHAQQIEELKTVAKMLNDTTTMQENRYYTLRALINGEK